MLFDLRAFFIVLILVAFLAACLYFTRFRRKEPVHFTELKFFPDKGTLKTKGSSLLPWLKGAIFLLFAIAFLDPHIYLPKTESHLPFWQTPKEGRVLFLLLDQSGSMKDPAVGKSLSKIELAKQAMEHFVLLRPQDMIGVVTFARIPTILAPPTLDHKAVVEAIKSIQPVKSPDKDGTGIGYAVFKTANLIASLDEQTKLMGDKAPYQIKSKAIILVTDGLQDPNPLDENNRFRSMDLEQSAQYAKSKQVKLYIINVDPSLETEKYLPNLNELKKMATDTGGDFYMIHSADDLTDLMDKINQLEKTEIKTPFNPSTLPTFYEKISYGYYFLGLGVILLILFILLEYGIMRSYP